MNSENLKSNEHEKRSQRQGDREATYSPEAARVSAFLLERARQSGNKTSRGTEIQLDLTRRDIGTVMGLTRREATLGLNALKNQGFITMIGSTIILLDEDGMNCLKRP